jgi:hypothetical protein
MNRRLRSVGVAAALCALLATASASSAASTARNDDGDTTVIHLTSKLVDEDAIDVGEDGDSLGDQFVFADDLFDDGRKVGTDGVVCTIVRIDGDSAASQCIATADLPKGQITAQVLLTIENGQDPETIVLAITGGTRTYKNAQGELKVIQDSSTRARLTFTLTD